MSTEEGLELLQVKTAKKGTKQEDTTKEVSSTHEKGMLEMAMTQALREGSGATATLNESGYEAVAHRKQNSEMEAFVRRVVKQLGMRITNEGKLQGMLPWYSGNYSMQSYGKLVDELHRTAKASGR